MSATKLLIKLSFFVILDEIEAHSIVQLNFHKMQCHRMTREPYLDMLLARSSRFRCLSHYSLSRQRLVQDLNNSWCDVWFRSHSWHCMNSRLTTVSTCHLLLHQRQRKTYIWLRSCLSNKSRKVNAVPSVKKKLKQRVVNKCACFEGELAVGKVKFKTDFKPCKM